MTHLAYITVALSQEEEIGQISRYSISITEYPLVATHCLDLT